MKALSNRIVSLFILASGFVFVCSCSISQKEDDKILKIDLTDDNFQPKSILLSEIADSIRYIKLETTDQSLISKIKQVEFSKNFVLIYDSEIQKLLLFNKYGKFLHEIGNKGKGPGEFVRIEHFFITYNEKYIMVLADNHILQYSNNGNFIKLIPIPSGIYPRYIFPMSKETFLLIQKYPNTLLTENYSFFQTTITGEIINRKLKIIMIVRND